MGLGLRLGLGLGLDRDWGWGLDLGLGLGLSKSVQYGWLGGTWLWRYTPSNALQSTLPSKDKPKPLWIFSAKGRTQ